MGTNDGSIDRFFPPQGHNGGHYRGNGLASTSTEAQPRAAADQPPYLTGQQFGGDGRNHDHGAPQAQFGGDRPEPRSAPVVPAAGGRPRWGAPAAAEGTARPGRPSAPSGGERSYQQPPSAPIPPPGVETAHTTPVDYVETAVGGSVQDPDDVAGRAVPSEEGRGEEASPPRQQWPTSRPAGQPRAWPHEPASPRPPSWVDPQPQPQPNPNPPPALPEWMVAPVDTRFVDQRVGDDEESLTFNADRLDLVGKRKLPPGRGWRKLLYRLTFHKLNLGLSPSEIAHAEMVETIRQPIRGDYKLGVVSLKGGVGKTTISVTLGSMFAQLRKGDRVVALDGNPDFGNLVSRVPRQTNTTVKDLLADEDLSRYGDVRHHTSQNIHGLEVVAGERDLAQSEAFSKSEYERVVAVLQRHYSLIFTDCGTGLINDAMAGVLETANTLILVSSVTVDGARAASANIEWLLIHGHQHLVKRAVVILNTNKQGKSSANIDQLKEHFSPHVRAVHVIPFDEHLAEGGEVNLDLLQKKTRRAFLELAELIATDFPNATGKHTKES